MNPTQSRRHLGIKTPLGDDALLLLRFTVRERISGPFEIEADLASAESSTDFNKVVGHAATIRLELGDNGTRYFNGYMSRLVHTGKRNGLSRFRATLKPWPWLLTRTADCRIFQRMSVVKIVEDVFNRHRFGADFYELRLSKSYPERRYCVQYRETDYNFFNRLLESEGIYYWFEHSQGGHKMVLADGAGGSKPRPGYASVEFSEMTNREGVLPEALTEWFVEKELQSVAYHLKDFDFKKPSEPLKGKHEISREHGMARFALYDYPGEYFEAGNADHYAQVRLEEHQARFEMLQGTGTVMGLAAGAVFDLKSHPQSDQNRKYLITEVNLQADAGEFTSAGGGGENFFSCQLTAVPSATQYRPARVTPKPIVQGVQTATVVGKSGEEIDVDEHGRVMVQFHWDRHGGSNEESSCRVRVAQAWAGNRFGSIANPRIGQEVIVEFLEGDPDRPIITGRVYNAEQMPPYELPANKTQTGIKTHSSQGGSDANFNEIRFEDKAGAEEIYIHAEKDQNNLVEHDETTQVGHDRTENVGHDEFITVDHDRVEKVKHDEILDVDHDQSETVGNNRNVKIGANHVEDIGSSMTINVGSSLTEMVAVNYAETVGAAMELTVGAALAITVGGAMAETVGGAKVESVGLIKSENVGGNRSLNVGGDKNETIGKNRTVSVVKDQKTTIGGQQQTSVTKESILNAKKVQIVARDELQLKAGSAEITLKKNGDILIKGNKIQIKGDGDVVVTCNQGKIN